ncbi:MAG: PIN domain nuclease, partial [Gemmatimonadetes bacterium]|nr:PIN domain nuclease [Gemmatimonadota bacterium]
NLVRKEVSQAEARRTIVDYGAWYVVDNDQALLLEGIDLQARWQVSFWDSLILAAAQRAKAGVIWSEDFNTAQDYGGIVAVNPVSLT